MNLRTLRESDIPPIRDLYASLKQRVRVDGHEKWKFFENPWANSPGVVAEVDGSIAGLFTVWPCRLNLSGEIILAGQSLDTMTRREFQGKGLFTRLANQSFEEATTLGMKMLYGYPNANSYPGFVRRLDWVELPELELWSLSLGRRSAALWKSYYRYLSRRLEVSEHKIDAAELARRFSDYWKNRDFGKDYCRIHRDETWYNYRFRPASGVNYINLDFHFHGQRIAWAIIGQDTQGGAWKLSELYVPGEDPRLKKEVLATVARSITMRGGSELRYFANPAEDGIDAELKGLGFRKELTFPLITRKLIVDNLPANPYRFQNWFIQPSDFDAF